MRRPMMLMTMLVVVGPNLIRVAAQEAGPGQAAKVAIGKDTTYVSGPLDQDGYIDYAAALNERLGKGVTPENNANVLLWQALGPAPEGGAGMPAEFFRLLGIEQPPPQGPYLIGLTAYLRDHAQVAPEQVNSIAQQQNRAGQRPWSAQEYPHIAGWLNANEKPLALAVAAAQRPEYFSPLVIPAGASGLNSVLLPGVQKCRELGHALACRAMLRVGAGKYDDAWQDLLACQRLGRLMARGATLIEGLVGIAVNQIATQAGLAYLERAVLTPAQIQTRLNELQQLPPLPPLADKIGLGERFMYLDTVQNIGRGNAGVLDALAGGGKKADPKARAMLTRIDTEEAMRLGNQWYDRLAATLGRDNRAERIKELTKVDNELKVLKAATAAAAAKVAEGKDPEADKTAGKSLASVLVTLLLPATRQVHDAWSRAEQAQRNLYVAFAVAAYRREHGRYPAELGELVPLRLEAVPQDLFSGKDLVWRPAENGYLLYSVGVNGKDEGGRWSDDKPAGDDLRVRMPLASIPVAVARAAPPQSSTAVVARQAAPPPPVVAVPLPAPSDAGAPRGRLTVVLIVSLGILICGAAAILALLLQHRRRSAEPRSGDEPEPGASASAPPPPSSLACACSICGKKLKIKPQSAGKRIKCPHCGTAAIPLVE